MATTTEGWRVAWREGFAPHLPTAGLRALRAALVADDPRLVQGRTTDPPPLAANERRPPTGACALGFCGWAGAGLATVGEVVAFFGRVCRRADASLHPVAAQQFLFWYDNIDRAVVRRELLDEVRRELRARRGPAQGRGTGRNSCCSATAVEGA